MKRYTITTDKSWSRTKSELADCFAKWGVRDWEANANVMESRTENQTLSQTERGVTVRYIKGGKTVTLSLNTQERPVDNLRALYLCIEDMRMIEARGLADTVQSAYLQLAAPAAAFDPWELFGLRPGAGRDEIEAMYRVKARQKHPDAGGTDEEMAQLNAARERLLAEVMA